MTPSQYNAYIRQRQEAIRRYNQEVERFNRERRAAAEQQVRDYNREVDRVNAHNKRVVDDHNREVYREREKLDAHNKRVITNYNREVRENNRNRHDAITKYNQAVRSHNAEVERDRQRRLASLRAVTSTRYVEVRNSSLDLGLSFDKIGQVDAANQDILLAAEQESINSVEVAYALAADDNTQSESADDTGILDYLSDLSQDLCDRWKGALFALNPANADAGRHFCTSVREIFTEILGRWALDRDVVNADPHCEITPNGTPSRRAKIKYLLTQKGAESPEMLGFVEKDIDDILQLFPVFNKATHGAAGTHTFSSLQSLRRRVEGGIMFLATIATQ